MYLSHTNLCRNWNLVLVGAHKRRALNDTASNRELSAVACEEGIDIASALATLIDTPNNKGLATTAVTSGEDTGKVGVVVARRCLDVLAPIKLDNFIHNALLGTQETHGEQN